jgi:5-methylcytosine-specific restriction endonuclease McrA
VVLAGRKRFRVGTKSHKSTFSRMLQRSESYPVSFATVGERRYWRFGDRWFWDNEGLSADQVQALLVTRDQRRQASISRAQSTVAMTRAPVPAARGAIPEDMKHLVWTRDQGKCRLCGSNVELQFDHIIPWSMGGATSPENIQVLCGPCNRRKGASVASPSSPAVQGVTYPAGWYPDPSGANGGQRFWDGRVWTESTR